jgi:hypothetical protein
VRALVLHSLKLWLRENARAAFVTGSGTGIVERGIPAGNSWRVEKKIRP